MGRCTTSDFTCNECEGYPRKPHDPIWSGMFFIQTGQNLLVGCDQGCIPCGQQELESHSAELRGNRWMKPFTPIGSEANRPNRLANGMMGDLLSMHPAGARDATRRVPGKIVYRRGVCWNIQR